MKSIVVPVNFSLNSSNAARYAADLALALEADLHLVHVVQIPVSVSEVPMPDYIFEEMQENDQEALTALADELGMRTRKQVTIRTDQSIGGVEYKLEEYCARVKPFMVVMGASGHTLETMLAGNNTLRAMRNLPYPLLVVPGQAVFHVIEKIVLACDPEDLRYTLVKSKGLLDELRDAFGARFEILHITADGARPVQTGVKERVEGESADWLLVFPKKHHLLEFHTSRSRKIVEESLVPVLLLHQ